MEFTPWCLVLSVLGGKENLYHRGHRGSTEITGEILLAVGNPDIFYLDGMLEKPSALGEFGIKPIDGAALVCPNLLQIAN
jgi:hypothetical protein